MHTINGRPANYIKEEQICYFSLRNPIHLCSSILKIKKQQRASNKWRKKQGFKTHNDYGCLRVVA